MVLALAAGPRSVPTTQSMLLTVALPRIREASSRSDLLEAVADVLIDILLFHSRTMVTVAQTSVPSVTMDTLLSTCSPLA